MVSELLEYWTWKNSKKKTLAKNIMWPSNDLHIGLEKCFKIIDEVIIKCTQKIQIIAWTRPKNCSNIGLAKCSRSNELGQQNFNNWEKKLKPGLEKAQNLDWKWLE